MMKPNLHGRTSRGRILLWAASLSLLLPPLALGATIVLKSGESITTHRYVRGDGYVEFSYNGLITRIADDRIERIESEPGSTPPPPAPLSPSPSPGLSPGLGKPQSDVGSVSEAGTGKPADTDSGVSPAPPAPGGDGAEAAGRDTAYLSRIISAISEYRRQVGFRDLFWDCRAADIYGLEKVGTDPVLGGLDEYVRHREKLKFGDADLAKVVYGFWRNRLISVTLWTEGESDYRSMQEEAFERFGKGVQVDPAVERRIWAGAVSSKYLEFDPSTGKGLLWFRNRDLWERAAETYPAEAHPAESPEIGGHPEN